MPQKFGHVSQAVLARTTVIDGEFHRLCDTCQKWKPLLTSYHVNIRYFMSHVHKCKECVSTYYEERNTPEKNRIDRLKRFDLTPEDYERMYNEQQGKCKICNKFYELKAETSNKILHVDHCHSTGKVRGLLCTDCNQGIGHLKDSITLLESAIEYIRGVK